LVGEILFGGWAKYFWLVKSKSASWSSLLVFPEESTLYKYRQKVVGRLERGDQEILLFF